MPAAARRPWLICYDISDPQRLGRVHRYLRRYATPVQYSVFLAKVSAAELGNVMGGIAARIDSKYDDVRAYPLMEGAPVHCAGRQILPEDVLLLDEGLELPTRSVA